MSFFLSADKMLDTRGDHRLRFDPKLETTYHGQLGYDSWGLPTGLPYYTELDTLLKALPSCEGALYYHVSDTGDRHTHADLCTYTNKLKILAPLNGKVELPEGTFYFDQGQLHRVGAAAATYANGQLEWFQHGILHRHAGPAIVEADGTVYWFNCGLRHRERDLPAVTYANGDMEWYWNDKLHREYDRPAIIQANGTRMWFQQGLLHRDHDLPAIIYASSNVWSFHDKHTPVSLPIIPSGTLVWYDRGVIHRESKRPAIIYGDGCKQWWTSGKFQWALPTTTSCDCLILQHKTQ